MKFLTGRHTYTHTQKEEKQREKEEGGFRVGGKGVDLRATELHILKKTKKISRSKWFNVNFDRSNSFHA